MNRCQPVTKNLKRKDQHATFVSEKKEGQLPFNFTEVQANGSGGTIINVYRNAIYILAGIAIRIT